MKPEQFDKMMEKLEEIRCGIIDCEPVEPKTSPDSGNRFLVDVNEFRAMLWSRLEAQPTWGRNQIKVVLDEIIESFLRNR